MKMFENRKTNKNVQRTKKR